MVEYCNPKSWGCWSFKDYSLSFITYINPNELKIIQCPILNQMVEYCNHMVLFLIPRINVKLWLTLSISYSNIPYLLKQASHTCKEGISGKSILVYVVWAWSDQSLGIYLEYSLGHVGGPHCSRWNFHAKAVVTILVS